MNISKTFRFRHALMLSLALFLFSCNNTGDKTTATADTTIKENHAEHEGEHEAAIASALTLNNGAKWQTDESTRMHVNSMLDTLHAFHAKTNADHNTYSALAVSMQKEMDSLIKDCKMKGPEHEALHLWLNPVLQDIKKLTASVTAEEGKEAAEKLSHDVEIFNQYFN